MSSPPADRSRQEPLADLGLDGIVETMKEMSLQTDPQEMVRAYGRRMKRLFPTQRWISLSRRGLTHPEFRVTRFSEWDEDINPWNEPERTPLHRGGLIADLIYEDRPRVIDDLSVAADDPAAKYLEGCRSLLAIPLFDQGQSLNMVLLARKESRSFDPARLAEHFWLSNLFGRATHSLLLSSQLRAAYEESDREMQTIANIQRSLLPAESPSIPGLKIATHYSTSNRAGGDYFDFFELPEGRWGMLIADVSGHGAPAAVVMAITHSIAHLYPNSSSEPGGLLAFLNEQPSTGYTTGAGFEAFVTAFYAVYDPADRSLRYATAGHNPPRVWRCADQRAEELNDGGNLPLGLVPGLDYPAGTTALNRGDRLVMYTDGIVESSGPDEELFGTRRLDLLLAESCHLDPQVIVDHIIGAVGGFTHGAPAEDDRTMIVALVE